jgi:plastocyanin
MINARRSLAAVAVAASLTVAACGSGSDRNVAEKPAADKGGATITISNFAFKPNPLQAKVGDTITVKNDDDAAHTATADDKSFDTGQLGKGAAKTITLSKAGAVAFHCDIHNYMTGVIQVS